jgi:predicted O-methyltransferase YrrM
MSITGFLYRCYVGFAGPRQIRKILETPAPAKIKRENWDRSLADPTAFYHDCYRFFHQRLPAEVREHRAYYQSGKPPHFGEDAFHVMWYLLFEEFKPKNFLEIGVFRGQTITLAALLSRLNGVECQVAGISPFCDAGDSVSKYPTGTNYLQDTLSYFEHFKLTKPELLKAYSTDAEAVALIRSISRDMIYIDGNHDYEIVAKDWAVCSESIRPGGIIVMDDAGATTAFQPTLFATKGWPGPSQFAQEIDRRKFREILQVGHNRVFQRID